MKAEKTKIDSRLNCIYTQYKKYEQLYIDAEWEGKETKFFEEQFLHYKKLLDTEEFYEPKF